MYLHQESDNMEDTMGIIIDLIMDKLNTSKELFVPQVTSHCNVPKWAGCNMGSDFHGGQQTKKKVYYFSNRSRGCIHKTLFGLIIQRKFYEKRQKPVPTRK